LIIVAAFSSVALAQSLADIPACAVSRDKRRVNE